MGCYTKYGDCCTDHFVKCYQKLKLCLISIDDEKSEKEDKEGNGKKKFITEKNSNEYARTFTPEQELEAKMTQRSMFLSKRDHITPNECCDGELEWSVAGTLCSKK